jgi:hypothetical protein
MGWGGGGACCHPTHQETELGRSSTQAQLIPGDGVIEMSALFGRQVYLKVCSNALIRRWKGKKKMQKKTWSRDLSDAYTKQGVATLFLRVLTCNGVIFFSFISVPFHSSFSFPFFITSSFSFLHLVSHNKLTILSAVFNTVVRTCSLDWKDQKCLQNFCREISWGNYHTKIDVEMRGWY